MNALYLWEGHLTQVWNQVDLGWQPGERVHELGASTTSKGMEGSCTTMGRSNKQFGGAGGDRRRLLLEK